MKTKIHASTLLREHALLQLLLWCGVTLINLFKFVLDKSQGHTVYIPRLLKSHSLLAIQVLLTM